MKNKLDKPKWVKGKIEGVIVKQLVKHIDQRGYLCETFRLDELPQGLKPMMSYISYTEPGIVRGPHEHIEQTDVFAFNGPGNFLLRLWDNRIESSSYLNYTDINAGEDNPLLVVVPHRVVHSYKNISSTERGMVINYPNRLFKGPGKKEEVDEVRHEDGLDSPFQME